MKIICQIDNEDEKAFQFAVTKDGEPLKTEDVTLTDLATMAFLSTLMVKKMIDCVLDISAKDDGAQFASIVAYTTMTDDILRDLEKRTRNRVVESIIKNGGTKITIDKSAIDELLRKKTDKDKKDENTHDRE